MRWYVAALVVALAALLAMGQLSGVGIGGGAGLVALMFAGVVGIGAAAPLAREGWRRGAR